ncbi:hypothetical protein ABU614_00860 [Lysobacter firmicutimachus]|uniref:Uncharacterized protein n=1 Tax=Lysobacter firmicutimachus TaxID=1792846 RepID=A0AAU8MSX9_9GAMM
MVGTWRFHRWTRRPERPEFGMKMNDNLSGGSLREALAQAGELQRFELD